MLKKDITIVNQRGLHARAAAKLMKAADQFDIDIRVGCRENIVNAKSILDLLTLGAAKGTIITLEVDEGTDAQTALNTLSTLIENGFGEDQSSESSQR